MTKKLEMSAGTMPEVGPSQLQLLEKLCNAVGVSGDEYEVRQIVLEEIKLLADDVKVDALGNVLATKYGRGENRVRVMLDAHMDEIGFMIVKKHDDGLFQFETVGGIDVRQLPGKSVLVGTGPPARRDRRQADPHDHCQRTQEQDSPLRAADRSRPGNR